MKKFIALFLALSMMVGLLAGCGDGQGENPDNGQDVNPGNSASVEGEDTYKMVMMIVNYGFDDPDLKMVQDAVNEITIPEIGVEVEFLTVPIMNQATKLSMMVAGNEKIDLVVTGLLTTPNRLASEGLIQPITQYVEESEALSSLAEGIIGACTIDGEIYAYPGSTANGVQVMFFYDKDLAEQYNIQLPDRLDSPEKWRDLFEQVKNSGMEQYGISLGDGAACEYEWTEMETLGDDAYCSYGVILDMENGTEIVNYYATDEYRAKCEMHREWYLNGYCVPDSNSNGYTTTDSMTQGMIFGFVSNGGVSMSDAYFSKTTGKNIGSIPMTDMITKSGNVVNFSWGVSTTCENPAKVVEFLELLYTNTDLANLMNNGIEGVHYVVNEGSQIISYPEGVDASNCGYGSYVGSYGDVSKIYQREPLTDEYVASIPNYMYPNAPVSRFLSYSFDSTNVAAELTNVSAVINQYAPALECGIVDPDEMIPQFLEALEEAGIDKVIAENQSQLDEWLANQ